MRQDVHDFYEGTNKIAIIDNTNNNYIKVILVDEPQKYFQCFFVDTDFKDLVERCKTMRKIGIKSL